MTRPLRSARSALAGTALLLTTLVGASSASAAPRQPLEYDALGDSYAAGVGVPPYTPDACHQSDAAYAVQIDGREKIHLDQFVACAGATTSGVLGQVGVLNDSTDLVTVSVGGNDIGWGAVVGACLYLSDQTCDGAVRTASGAITAALPGLLNVVYTQIRAHAPNAQVIVTGYPRLFSPEYGAYLGASVAEQQALNDGADLLNATIKQVATVHGFRFVDVTKRFDGHGVNAPVPWVNGATDPAAFHPNAAGYQAYTAAVTAAVVPSRSGA